MPNGRIEHGGLGGAAASALTACILFALGCDGDRVIAVELVTDYTPGEDFTEVRIGIAVPDAVEFGDQRTFAASEDVEFLTGRRVASYTVSSAETYSIRTQLAKDDGSIIASRIVRVEVDGPVTVTVVIGRDPMPEVDAGVDAGSTVDGGVDAGVLAMCEDGSPPRRPADGCQQACPLGRCEVPPGDDNAPPLSKQAALSLAYRQGDDVLFVFSDASFYFYRYPDGWLPPGFLTDTSLGAQAWVGGDTGSPDPSAIDQLTAAYRGPDDITFLDRSGRFYRYVIATSLWESGDATATWVDVDAPPDPAAIRVGFRDGEEVTLIDREGIVYDYLPRSGWATPQHVTETTLRFARWDTSGNTPDPTRPTSVLAAYRTGDEVIYTTDEGYYYLYDGSAWMRIPFSVDWRDDLNGTCVGGENTGTTCLTTRNDCPNSRCSSP